MKSSFEFVIARYDEDSGWIEHLLAHNVYVTIYDKGCPINLSPDLYAYSNLKTHTLQNIGREADTYLQHICTRYDDLAEYTIFVQGDPWPHIQTSFPHTSSALLEKVIDYSKDTGVIQIGGAPLVCNNILDEQHPPPFHMRVDVHAAYDNLFPVKYGPRPKSYIFAAGAQYIIHRDKIRTRPLCYWEYVLESLHKDNVNAWELERLWMYLLNIVSSNE